MADRLGTNLRWALNVANSDVSNLPWRQHVSSICRAAGFQSALSAWNDRAKAGWKPAIQQTGSLRYRSSTPGTLLEGWPVRHAQRTKMDQEESG
jgi:hypothetical protein